jgi:hypothetical protein
MARPARSPMPRPVKIKRTVSALSDSAYRSIAISSSFPFIYQILLRIILSIHGRQLIFVRG